MHLALVIDIRGEVDQPGLERLRSHLNLKKQGRLTDDWDQEFGYRKVSQNAADYFQIGLFRNFNGSWKVQVLHTKELHASTDDLANLRDELVQAITAAGFQATTRDKPTFGSAQ